MLSKCLTWKIIRNCHSFWRSHILGNGFNDYIEELGDWLCLPKIVCTYRMISYTNTRFVCTVAVVCTSASSDQSFVFWKVGIVSWAPDWTFPISAMQYFIPELVFIDHCVLNRSGRDITASLLSYISLLETEIISCMQCLFCLLE